MLRQRSSTSSSAAAAVSNWRCQFLILGLFYIVMQCDARAVNVSNTWTMPQEGLNVFYRFFRDRISWFEADAVCQFHHANLVTVDNSFQFDATRDLLRELDVNDIVWIGLMRPQSSDRFMWSNSRPLVADTGYWAESLPLMDAPLCAVIDPIRDYRWHALRCGGPETASFLCEMPVPNWADTCILKDMPNLTMQYMADTASIELIRNCQEEGLLRTTCRGKQDRDRALQDLICPRERLEAQRINDITNSHFKSLQIINSIPSDNNENNDIELLPMDVNYAPNYPEDLQTEKNTVQRLIEQFNVDDLMQADEPANMETVSSFYKIPGLIPKPVKKSAKKVLEYPKKDAGKKDTMQVEKKDRTRIALEMDDMMLGDQPQGEPEMSEQILNEEVSNEILEPLPHIKKTNIHKEEAEKMDREAIAMKESMQKSKEMQAKKLAAMKPMTTTTTTPATTEKAAAATMTTVASTSTLTPETSAVSTTSTHSASTTSNNKHSSDTTPKPHSEESSTEVETTHGHASTTLSPATIGHPMHPQQPRTNVNSEDTQRTHVKESTDNSHFIPPMLLVKSHYVPPTNKHGHSEHHSHAEHLEAATNEDVTETTKSHVENNGMTMTTPKVIDLDAQAPTSMSMDAKHEKQQQQQRQQELNFNPSPVITEEQTTENGNMKPITPANDSEQEQRKNVKYRNLEEATATTTTLPPLATTKPHTKDDTKDATLQTTTMKFVEGNLNGNDDNTDDTAKGVKADDVATAIKTIMTQELKPQTDIETETTRTTKLVAATALPTTLRTDIAAGAAAVATTEDKHGLMTETTQATKTQQQMEYVKVTTEKSDLTLAQQQQQQQTNVDHEKLQHSTEAQKTDSASTRTTATIPKTTDATSGGGDQATETTTTGRRIILATDIEATQKTEISGEMKHKEEILAASEGPRDKKETFVTTTEVLTTKTSTAAPATASVTTTLAPSMSAAAATTTTTTATATVQPTTETIANTSISKNSNTPLVDVSTSTNTATTTTTTPSRTTTTAAGSTSTSTPPPSVSPSVTSPADTTTTTTDAPASEASPETTRNFLKVTTEMPFKPNRRRSLTKPDTVSYMKKILG